MKSWTASEDVPVSVSEEICSPPTRRITSPTTPIGSRAVTRIVSPGQAESHLLGQLGAGRDQVLAVVQDHQRSPGRQEVDHGGVG
jgi:hypothetical protein